MFHGQTPLAIALLLSATAFAADIPVAPGQSIQAAIDSASPGDRIVVQPGTYFEAIDFKSKAIEVIGVLGPKVTTIDAAGLGSRVVTIPPGTTWARLEGFRITGGSAAQGGGIHAAGTANEIVRCIVTANSAGDGGGLAFLPTSPLGTATLTVTDSTFEANAATGSGGGLFVVRDAVLSRCRIVANTATDGAGIAVVAGSSLTRLSESELSDNVATGNGGAIRLGSYPNQIDACRFQGNRAARGGGLYWKVIGSAIFNSTTVTSSMFVDNHATSSAGAMYLELTANNFFFGETKLHAQKCTFVGNSAPSFGAIQFLPSTIGGSSPPRVEVNSSILWANGPNPISVVSGMLIGNSDVEGGFAGTGNLAVDPMFFDLAGRDLHLKFGSPCIDKGVPLGGLTTWVLDFESDPIVGASDMGADEFHRHIYTTGTVAAGGTVQLHMIGFPNETGFLLLSAGLASSPLPAPPYGSVLVSLPLLPHTPFLLRPINADGSLVLQDWIPAALAGATAGVQCAIGPKLTNALFLEL